MTSAAVKESQIVHEAGRAWVARLSDSYVVFVCGVTHSVSDSFYAKDVDGLSIAIARANYLGGTA